MLSAQLTGKTRGYEDEDGWIISRPGVFCFWTTLENIDHPRQ